MSGTRAFVALGSNLGDPAARLDAARRALAASEGIEVRGVSAYHSTAPVGGPEDQPTFLNAVVELATELSPYALLERLQEIERAEGRDRAREPRWGPRELDLDLLLHGDSRVDSSALQLPHPRLEERLFVLAPLAELAPDLVLPGCGRMVLARADELAVRTRGGRGILSLESVAEARSWCRETRSQGHSLGFVPTMGALHEGHLGLVRRALSENERVCVSVFVNPLQFDEVDDLVNYPRDFAGDAELLEALGTSMVFTGTLAEFFEGELDERGELPAARRLDPGFFAVGLEGAYRTGHLDGVATIVDRLFDVVEPTRAYFGQKDYQQARLVHELGVRRGRPQVVVCPTSREPSGLARSSRNTRLSASERELAAAMSRSLFRAAALWQSGEREAEALTRELRRGLDAPGLELEYAELRGLEEWSAEPPRGVLESAVALVAARVGPVRLIDNFVLSDALPKCALDQGL